MSYQFKVVVHALDDPRIIKLLHQAAEAELVHVLEFTLRAVDARTIEVYMDFRFEDLALVGKVLGRIEAVKGAAVMAATPPKVVPPSKGSDS